jgi:hypothetical protein
MKRISLSAAWPIVVLLGVLAYAQTRSGKLGGEVQSFRLKIAGYDPKDLLRGRYLQFRVDWTPDPEAELSVESAWASDCLCLRRDPQTSSNALTRPLSCAEAVSAPCDAYVTNESLAGLTRYYLPEDAAPVVEEIFRDPGHVFEIDANVTPNGNIAATALLIDGVSWEAAVSAKQAEETQQ